MGLPVPREAMILTGDIANPNLIGKDSGKDYTDEMMEYCRLKVEELKVAGLDGFILKKSSPSCGVRDVRVYDDLDSEESSGKGFGLFAAMVQGLLPDLPIAEESDLDSPEAIEKLLRRMQG